jgi:3-oxoadipate enol-lactonase
MTFHYLLDGPRDAPVVVLPSSLGTTTELWSSNVPHWSESFRILRYDQAGHDSIDALGRDLLDLLDQLELERVSLCGLSLGGATAMWVAANAPQRVDRLVLACTSARFGGPEPWLERAAVVRAQGLEPIADGIVGRWFTPAAAPEVVRRFRQLLVATPREKYAACCEALARWDFRERLGGIRMRTLVVAAAEDSSTPPEHARLIADAIEGATLVVLPDAAHLANVERAEAFSVLVAEHLAPAEVV